MSEKLLDLDDVYSISQIIAAIEQAIQVIDKGITSTTSIFEAFRQTELKLIDDEITEIRQEPPPALTEEEKESFYKNHFRSSIFEEYGKKYFASDLEILYSMIQKAQLSEVVEAFLEKREKVIYEFITRTTKNFRSNEGSICMKPSFSKYKNNIPCYSYIISKLYEKAILVGLKGLDTEYFMGKIQEYEAHALKAQEVCREMSDLYMGSKKESETHRSDGKKLLSDIEDMIEKIKRDIQKLYGEHKWINFDIEMIAELSWQDISELPDEVVIKIFDSKFSSVKIPRMNDGGKDFAVKGDPDYVTLAKRMLNTYVKEKNMITP